MTLVEAMAVAKESAHMFCDVRYVCYDSKRDMVSYKVVANLEEACYNGLVAIVRPTPERYAEVDQYIMYCERSHRHRFLRERIPTALIVGGGLPQ